MTRKRSSPARPARWMRKTVRATATKAKNRKDPLRAEHKRSGSLSRAEIEKFRRMLIKKRWGLLADVFAMEGEVRGTNRRGQGLNLPGALARHTRSPAEAYQQDVKLSLLKNERALLQEVDDALLRIEEGTYGICLGTGRPIRRARLTARPWAMYCIEYARMGEKVIAFRDPPKEVRP